MKFYIYLRELIWQNYKPSPYLNQDKGFSFIVFRGDSGTLAGTANLSVYYIFSRFNAF